MLLSQTASQSGGDIDHTEHSGHPYLFSRRIPSELALRIISSNNICEDR
jgi:hypothetical protein